MRRPVVVISADSFNRSSLRTVTVAVLTTNSHLGSLPGNVTVPAGTGGLESESVVNVTQIATVDRSVLEEQLGEIPDWLLAQLDAGLMRALGLVAR